MAQNEIKDLTAPAGQLGEIIENLLVQHGNGLDRVRSVLSMRMNQYNDIQLTKDEQVSIARAFLDIELGTSTNLVMICSKRRCLYKDRCALYVSSKCPEGRECLHENKIIAVSMDQYMTSLEVDPQNYPEMVLVNQLVECELIDYRCNAILSNDHTNLKMTSVIGLDQQGNVITKEEISHAWSIKDQIAKRKISLLESFTFTRKEKYKKQAALKESKDGHAKLVSGMKERLSALKTKTVDFDEVKRELTNPLQDEEL